MSAESTQDLCTSCAIPLSDMPCGCRLRVSDLTGSPATRSKLYAMGILPGTEMEVRQSGDGAGGICVRVRQSSLVLGESLARSVYCSVIDDGDGKRR